jgi:rubrerythrin
MVCAWRDERAAEIAARHPGVPATLDAATEMGATYCETARYAERWAYSAEESAWYCRDCGHLVEDTDDGCTVCGYGTPDEDDDED